MTESALLSITKPAMTIRRAQCFAFTPDGEHLVISKAHSTADARVIALSTGDETLRFEKLPPKVRGIVVSDNGRLIAFGHQYRAVTVCNAQTGSILHRLNVANDGEISGLLFVPGSETLIHSSSNGLTAIDAHNGSIIRSLQSISEDSRPPMNTSVAFAQSGDYFAVSCITFDIPDRMVGEIQTYSWPSCEMVRREVLPSPVNCIAFHPIDNERVIHSNTGIVLVQIPSTSAIAEPELLIDQSFTTGSTRARPQFGEFAFSPDGSRFAFVQIDLLGLWDWKTRRVLGKWRMPDDTGAMQVRFAPSGNRIAIEVYLGVLIYSMTDLINNTI